MTQEKAMRRKFSMPPNDPCIRCNGVIKAVDTKLICSECGQLWTIGPEGCWEAELEVFPVARVEQTITVSKQELLEVLKE